jgi:cell division protein FtsB
MMVRIQRQRLTPTRLLRPLLWMLLAFYMGYHTLHGERGLYALVRDQRQEIALKRELAETKITREAMERRVANLRDSSLDRDLLDEQMRRMLGVMQKGEVVVLMGDEG